MRRRMKGSELPLELVTAMWMAALLTRIAGLRRQQWQQRPSNSRSSKSNIVWSKSPAAPAHHLRNRRRRKRRKTEAGLRADHLLEERERKAQRKRNTGQSQRKGSTGLQVPRANTNPRKRKGRGPPVSLHLRKAAGTALPPLMGLPHQTLLSADQAVSLCRKEPP